jgi:hypothetical protein
MPVARNGCTRRPNGKEAHNDRHRGRSESRFEIWRAGESSPSTLSGCESNRLARRAQRALRLFQGGSGLVGDRLGFAECVFHFLAACLNRT